MTFNEYNDKVVKWLSIMIPIDCLYAIKDNLDYGTNTMWNFYKGNKMLNIKNQEPKDAALIVLKQFKQGLYDKRIKGLYMTNEIDVFRLALKNIIKVEQELADNKYDFESMYNNMHNVSNYDGELFDFNFNSIAGTIRKENNTAKIVGHFEIYENNESNKCLGTFSKDEIIKIIEMAGKFNKLKKLIRRLENDNN